MLGIPLSSFVVILLASFSLAAAEFQPLADLPGGKFHSRPADLSADGVLVVGSSLSDMDAAAERAEAFLWTPDDGMVGLGALAANHPVSGAFAISADGSTLVGSSFSLDASVAVRWTNQSGVWQIHPLVDPAEETPFRDFSAHGVSRDGSTIVGRGSYVPVDGVQHFQGGFIWSEASGIVHLPPAPWFDENQIIRMRDISADGHVVLGTSLDTETGGTSATGERSFLWTASEGFTEIPREPQVLSTDARAISDNGRTVVGGLDATGIDGFFRSALWWREDIGPVDLGGLPNNTPLGSILYGISGNGRVAVGQDWLDSGVLAVIWDEYHGFRSIQEILEINYGLTEELKGWKLEHAFAVSHNGRGIVGDGINPEGKVEAWRVVLDESELSAPIPGDADLSGDVGFEDFLRLNANYESGHFWYQGDFNGDYRVSVEDFSILLTNFGVSASSLDVSAVPEPTCDALLAIACAIGIGVTRNQSRLGL